MTDYYAHHSLPPLHAGMFKQEGYVHISISRMEIVPRWKLDLWLGSLVFHAGMNYMRVSRTEVKHGVVEFNWEPHR